MRFAARGIAGYQVYASADLGSIAYETEARDGLVVDEGVLVEIVRPGHRATRCAPGEVGEVVVTTLSNAIYPLIRFGTGDLSAFLAGREPVRPDQCAHQGMARARRPDDEGEGDVRPSVAGRGDRRASSGESRAARLVVDNPGGNDRMTLTSKSTGRRPPPTRSSASIRDVTKLRGEVAVRAPGELPNDGKVIDDLRKFD